MLAFRYRFHGRGGLRHLHRDGTAIRGRYTVLKYQLKPRHRSMRMAVIVSKKVQKGAVGRNRIRRRIYEILRHESARFRRDTGIDLAVIVTTPEVRTLDTPTLYASLVAQFRRAGLYKPPATSAILDHKEQEFS
ncbi:ribonuclease P protein component [Candidatus Saccharibacteria bacterium]|nr:MAG: ribonuclease P protein component [Candidatus Saccharibacteria bacterium]